MKQPILVVGATGVHGGTGRTVAELLLTQGRAVRVLARRDSERSAALAGLGAEIVLGDLLDRQSLIAALKDVEVAYFTYPVASGVVSAAANFASAARLNNVKRLVVMSMAVSHPDGPSHFGRDYWLAEEIFSWSGIACQFLRFVSFFYENIPLLHGRDIATEGVMKNAFLDNPLPWISGEDAGKFAAAAILNPDRFGSAAAIYPTGGFVYKHSDIAGIISHHLGRPIRHDIISEQEWCQRLIDLSLVDRRVNADMARHISALGAAFRGNMPPLNTMFEDMVGETPQSFEDAIKSGTIKFTDLS